MSFFSRFKRKTVRRHDNYSQTQMYSDHAASTAAFLAFHPGAYADPDEQEREQAENEANHVSESDESHTVEHSEPVETVSHQDTSSHYVHNDTSSSYSDSGSSYDSGSSDSGGSFDSGSY